MMSLSWSTKDVSSWGMVSGGMTEVLYPTDAEGVAAALREGDRAATSAEFADVLAWLATIANVAEVDLERAVLEKYGSGCPGCGEMVCRCDDAAKP